MASPSQPKSLIFDLEVAPGKAEQPDRSFMVGALRPDTGEEPERKVDKYLPGVLDPPGNLGQGANLVLGHNVIWLQPFQMISGTALGRCLQKPRADIMMSFGSVQHGADLHPLYLHERTWQWLATYLSRLVRTPTR